MSNLYLAGSHAQVDRQTSSNRPRELPQKLGVILDLEGDNDFTIKNENADGNEFF